MSIVSRLIPVLFLFVLTISCGQSSTTLLANSDMEGTIGKGSKVTFASFEEGQLSRNDVVLFDLELKELKTSTISMLRVVGLPGDKVEIIRGDIYVNDKPFPLPKTARFTYYVKSSPDFAQLTNDKYLSKQFSDSAWITYLDEQQANEVAKMPQVDSVGPYLTDSTVAMEGSVVYGENFRGKNHYYWGPYTIPKKGGVVDKDLIAVTLNYLQPFDEGGKVKHNYYFLISDNQLVALDSRMIGLIPESAMKGRLKKVE